MYNLYTIAHTYNVTGHVEAKKLLSRQRQSEYRHNWLTCTENKLCMILEQIGNTDFLGCGASKILVMARVKLTSDVQDCYFFHHSMAMYHVHFFYDAIDTILHLNEVNFALTMKATQLIPSYSMIQPLSIPTSLPHFEKNDTF